MRRPPSADAAPDAPAGPDAQPRASAPARADGAPAIGHPDEPAAEWLPIGELVPWEKNPRKNDKAVAKVIESIRTFGFGAPIIARRANREVIAGHTRLKAATKMGLERVPVRFLDVTEDQAHALALADNRIGEEAAWDDVLLASVLQELSAADVELASTGFNEHEITKLLADANKVDEGGVAVETAPDKLQKKWKTAPGQVWEIPSRTVRGRSHRIICGSSLDASVVERLMDGAVADMMWTDPPYGVSYKGKTDDALEIENDKLNPEQLLQFLCDCFRAAPLKPGAAWYVAHPAGPISLQFRLAVDAVGWTYRQGLVWVKDSMVLGRSDYHYKHEPIIFGYTAGGDGRRGRGGPSWNGGNAEVSTFEIERPKQNEFHPTMKPVELVARMVRNSSSPKGLVYEPFSGSGSTMLACETTSRVCHAVELDPKYVAVALERMAEAGCPGSLCT